MTRIVDNSRLLVSVSSYAEALLVLETEADILDIKNPGAGALGALPLEEIRLIVNANGGCKLTSATIGDLPMDAERVKSRVEETLSTGVDIVKIGLLPQSGRESCIHAIEGLAARGARIVAVIFADLGVELGLLGQLKSAGFYGVMLDTAHKDGRHLLDHVALGTLREFVDLARSLGMWSGLAGSLRQEHLATLVPLRPDYLGFRGGVCDGFERRNAIDATKIGDLHRMLHKCNTSPVQW